MKIRLYVITHNNDIALTACLKSLFDTVKDTPIQVSIINNYSKLSLDYPVEVLNNETRPDLSMGHLSRNWNQAIINGFKDLNNPDCDILITAQNDTIFSEGWLTRLVELHKTYSFITANPGDGFCSYTVNAIRRIGLWDERFCSIEYQEADYFLRALIFNRDESSINDFHHGRVLNPELTGEYDTSFVVRQNTDYLSSARKPSPSPWMARDELRAETGRFCLHAA